MQTWLPVFLFVLSLNTFTSAADEATGNVGDKATVKIRQYYIKKIDIILNHLPKSGNTVAIWDWDRTVSRYEGEVRPLREGEETKKVFHALEKKNIKSVIVTSRLEGYSPKQPGKHTESQVLDALKACKGMYDQGLHLLENGALKADPSLREFWVGGYRVVIDGQTVFAGALQGLQKSNKAAAVKYLIDNDLFTTKPDNLMVIDDAGLHLAEFPKEFQGRSENIDLYHYPEKWFMGREGFIQLYE